MNAACIAVFPTAKPRQTAIFFPMVILYNFFLCVIIYSGLGFWAWGLILGFLGRGFQVMGFGACGVVTSGFFGLGLSI